MGPTVWGLLGLTCALASALASRAVSLTAALLCATTLGFGGRAPPLTRGAGAWGGPATGVQGKVGRGTRTRRTGVGVSEEQALMWAVCSHWLKTQQAMKWC